MTEKLLKKLMCALFTPQSQQSWLKKKKVENADVNDSALPKRTPGLLTRVICIVVPHLQLLKKKSQLQIS